MRIRSTGLGKQEMKAQIKEIAVIKNDSLIMRCETSEPVNWKIRIVMGHADMAKLIPQLLKPSNLFGVIKLLFFKRGEAKPEGDW